MRRRVAKHVFLMLAMATFVLNPILAGAASVTLPSGKVVELSDEQVATIRSQPGVMISARYPETLANQTVIGLPQELGGAFLYGTPESLAQAFTTAGATIGAPRGAFAASTGLPTTTKLGIAAAAATAAGGAAAAALGGGGGSGSGTTTTAHH